MDVKNKKQLYSPAMRPASLVAWRWLSLKYAGTVITALSTELLRNLEASPTSFLKTCGDT
jgi:hypothetical protein